MNVRTKAAAVGVAVVMAMPVATTATAVDAYPPGSKSVSCKATTNANKSVLKVNMGPNQPGKRYYEFRIDVKRNGKWFRYLNTYKTQGKKETRTVNVPKGKYRVKCFGKFGFTSANSKVVKIRK